jgi:hypothetical protein
MFPDRNITAVELITLIPNYFISWDAMEPLVTDDLEPFRESRAG